MALNALLPPRCLGCAALVQTSGGLCASCWQGLRMISRPQCARCGLPRAHARVEADCLDAVCATQPFVLARSALAYNEASRGLLLRFKHGNGEWLAPRLGDWLWQAGQDIWPHADALVPVPLHWQRLRQRQYNQATLLARQVAWRTGLPLALGLLRRTKPTVQQKRLSALERQANLADAFTVSIPQAAAWQGRTVVLIDDVWTTGATLTSAAEALLTAGMGSVSAATVARVLRAEDAE